MSSGRRDYTWGFLDEAALWGRTTEDYSYFDDAILMSAEEVSIINYTVPAGVQLNINRVVIATQYICSCMVKVLKNEELILIRYIHEDIVMDFPERNPLRYNPGDVLKVIIINIDEAMIYIGCLIYGIITSTES